MRILVISNLYPPISRGGYEVECSAVVERLRQSHEVRVLCSSFQREEVPALLRDESQRRAEKDVVRALALLSPDARGALRAPLASIDAVRLARRLMGERPDLVYVWNGSDIPQAAIRTIADTGAPIAFRVCEHWFSRLFAQDQFMRELMPADRGAARRVWSLLCRAVNRLPFMQLKPAVPIRAAISWNSEAIRAMSGSPPVIEAVMERVGHSVPLHGDLYAAVQRSPAPDPEILFLGRVTAYKGVSVAIEALAILRSRLGLEGRLRVVGPLDSHYALQMRRLAEQRGLSAAVSFEGPAGPAEIASAFARAAALIVPSLWREPFPLVTIEGALAGVPVVASDVGGIAEGLQDQEHALLFPPGDAERAAAALARLIRMPEETEARVRRARARAEDFRLGPYLDAQEQFVIDAQAALRRAATSARA
ncbi:MAG TPA: glycosyltransferase [Solirubrobacteraceae bacterium]|nr:glycosyltransferase [Solirubrobacteraceae bacterium]